MAEFDLMFESGISREGDILDLGVKTGLIQKSGAWFQYGEQKLGQGREAAKAFLRGDSALSQELEKKLREVASKGELNVITPEE
jgi:recombination protein RecA